MLVGNQCLLGLDQLVLITLIYLQCGVFVRRLHDAMFGRIPFISSFLAYTGGVRGTKKQCEALMAAGVCPIHPPTHPPTHLCLSPPSWPTQEESEGPKSSARHSWPQGYVLFTHPPTHPPTYVYLLLPGLHRRSPRHQIAVRSLDGCRGKWVGGWVGGWMSLCACLHLLFILILTEDLNVNSPHPPTHPPNQNSNPSSSTPAGSRKASKRKIPRATLCGGGIDWVGSSWLSSTNVSRWVGGWVGG